MNILITGAAGFIGKNLAANLKNIKEGKNRTRDIQIDEIWEYDLGMEESLLEDYCARADFVFHLAGVNRPKEQSDFMRGNFGAAGTLLKMLKRHGNKAPVMLSGSIQASLEGRFADSDYGKSKLAGEELFFQYAAETGARVLVYRFPNVFGKWCRPNYNSAVATFCSAQANGLDYTINDRSTKLELLYIDDLVEEMLDALEGKEHRCEYQGMHPEGKQDGAYCYVPTVHQVTLGEISDLLRSFHAMPHTMRMPDMPEGSFVKKLYSTYLSYLPKDAVSYDVPVHEDKRGVFAELIKTNGGGQFSINITRPGMVRGEHWHNSKWEIFIVVSGHGLIQERKVGADENGRPYPVMEFEVCGRQMRAVQMLPGYTHNIINLSSTQDLVTVMWANEPFCQKHPDTFFEQVREVHNMECGSSRG